MSDTEVPTNGAQASFTHEVSTLLLPICVTHFLAISNLCQLYPSLFFLCHTED